VRDGGGWMVAMMWEDWLMTAADMVLCVRFFSMWSFFDGSLSFTAPRSAVSFSCSFLVFSFIVFSYKTG
jgi:hypothetical protein